MSYCSVVVWGRVLLLLLREDIPPFIFPPIPPLIPPSISLFSPRKRRSLARVGRLDSRPAAECAGATILAWNAAATDQDVVRAGGTTGQAVRDNGVTTNEAPRADEEAGCGVATVATYWGGVDTTVACNAAAAGRMQRQWGI